MNQEQSKASFITFYSFKGGVGRSMALINTAGILAGNRGFRVLVLDLDLEAPGLSYLDPQLPDTSPAQVQLELPLQPGFVDLLTDAKERGQEADLFTLSDTALETKYTQKIKIPDNLSQVAGGSLRIMPAGLFDHNYAQRLEALNLSALYREGLGEPLIRAFKKKLAESDLYDYVLVDSRTGISEGAGICTRDLADHLMILSGLNRQNVEGTCEFLREFRAATEGKKKFQIILSPMPNGEDKLLDDRRQVAEGKFIEAWGDKVDLSLEIPYHPQLALTEEPHIFRRRRGYLFDAYRAIEASMLVGLGHDAPTFRQRIMGSLKGKRYKVALQDLHHMLRLDGGEYALYRLTDELANAVHQRRGSGTEPSEEPTSIERLLRDDGGEAIVNFIIDKLSLNEKEWFNKRLLKVLKQVSPAHAKRLSQRILDAMATDADILRDYASYFDQAEDFDEAEAFHKKAIEADSKNAINLVDYAIFLVKRRKDPNGAEEYFKRAVGAAPRNSIVLGNYAIFLNQQRKDLDGAEAFYKQAIEVDPENSKILLNYAVFLMYQRKNMDSAETFFNRSIAADPKNAISLGSYAVFLLHQRRDMTRSEMFFNRSIAADSKNPATLGNFGQFLAGRGQLRDAMDTLKSAYRLNDDPESRDAAELCFSIWLVSRMLNQEAVCWERQFKFLIQKGFERYPWSFDCMLEQAGAKLSTDEFTYAKALAAALLDESKAGILGQFSRWQALEPQEPKVAMSDLN